MAKILPDGWRELEVTGAAQREIETLAILADGLPDEYTVYHAEHWTNVEQRYALYGEIDFAIVNQAGDLLLIEQKSGFLSEIQDGLVKQYPGKSKSVPVQISRMVGAIRRKLAARGDIPSVITDALLHCPDYTVSGLFNVTTVTTDSICEVTLSAGKYTLEELLPLALQDGEAVSIRASHLVGVVTRRNAPLQITRYWRLFSLQAWMTLQLRYVVFHGPATLILKGCRGVRIEAAHGERTIEQSATIGFSAHLNYGTTRTETFRPYLFGDSELLLDRFTGKNGIYIYEEMPTSSEPAGVTGRRIGGALDALMKVVGL